MAHLTHRNDVASSVRSTGGDAVNFPRSTQHRRAPSTVTAGLHATFALSIGTVVNIVPKSQVPHPLPGLAFTGVFRLLRATLRLYNLYVKPPYIILRPQTPTNIHLHDRRFR